MKSVLLTALFLSGVFSFAFAAAPELPASPAISLKKEIASIMSRQNLEFLREDVELVEVEFLINAKNELVILHVEGNHETTCEEVKKILEFREVRYQQPRQLIRYKVDLRLVKD